VEGSCQKTVQEEERLGPYSASARARDLLGRRAGRSMAERG